MIRAVGVIVCFNVFVYVNAQSICGHYYSVESRYKYKCGVWNAFRCTGTRYHQHYDEYCCPGYEHYSNCYPVCNGRTILNNACNEPYASDSIIYRGGGSRNSGGGTCSSPNYCTNCQDGFYQYGGQCLICPSIDNCNHRRCTTSSDNRCEYCQYEIVDKLYWRAYTRHYDGQEKQCKKACSWRSDSTRCFPGQCTNEIVETCSCTSGFGGSQCDTITEKTTILYAEIKLHNPSHETITTPLDPSDTGPQPVRFTNKNNLNAAEIEFRGKFLASGTPPPHDTTGDTHFVTDFDYGIVYGQMKLEYIIGSSTSTHTFSCPSTEDNPIKTNYICSRTNTNNSAVSLPTFGHSDRLVYTIYVRNGGFLKYINRETSSTIKSYLSGQTTTNSYTVQWDYVVPYYSCFQLHGTSCTVSPIDIQDVTDQKIIAFSWEQWSDDLAGVDGYEYEVFHLQPYGDFLMEGEKLPSSNRTLLSVLESELNVTTPGMYSIILTAFDKAGNYKSTRSLFFFDDNSFVETTSGTRMIVTESTSETDYEWVTTESSLLHVTWPGRFINERHDLYKWLNKIESNSHVDDAYDDKYGTRTVDWFTNIKGVIKFDINFTVSGPDVKSFQAYTDVPNILQESEILYVTWEDGQKLDISVKATDIIGEYAEDSITIYKDISNPELENLWLSYGNKTELFVHRLEDLSLMTFEWDTYDYHSGIYSVHWKVYDNYTGSDVLHGSSHVTAQGDASNVTSCEHKYQNSPRGPDCYCTIYHGCFHRHFHVKPEIVNGAGLTPGKDKGVHDSDYFIEITVVNKAMLSSVLTKKITIDISPPQAGDVHDGLPGSPEVDFQQEFYLNFYWNGFFDSESGVKYYKYVVSDHCWTKEDLFASIEGTETYQTITNYVAKNEGKYYMTVIAINNANEASDSVCSDGVTIMADTPAVTNFVLDGASISPILVKDTSNRLWIIRENLSRIVVNDTSICSHITSITEDIQLLPEADAIDIDCSNLPTVSSPFISILPRTSQLSMQWDSDMDDIFVHDYHIGLSSTKNNPAPDILPFRSTKHHRHFRLNYPDLTEGTLFYIIVKSTSKANVDSIQSYGPVVIDVTAPVFTGSHINLEHKDETLIANWTRTAFTDEEDPHPLTYQFALGHAESGTDVISYRPLQYNTKCIRTEPPDCTAIDTTSLDWSLHGHHNYYVTIKVTNLAGLSITKTSVVYTHDIQLPSAGIVYDINPNSGNDSSLKDLIDIDFSVKFDSLAAEWKGFYHPHLSLHYKVCVGTVKGNCDVTTKTNIDSSTNQHVFDNLLLKNFQKYYVTVEAVTKIGSIKESSDGITFINNATEISGVTINDGSLCSDPVVLNGSHHIRDIISRCETDIDYQTSTTTLSAKWEISDDKLKQIVRNAYWSIEQRSPVGDMWIRYRDFSYIGSQSHVIVNELDLQPGLTYRFTIKLCADDVCFDVISSNGVTVIPSYPVTGSIDVEIETQKLVVTIAAMYDPDIEDRSEAIDAIGVYEWAINGGSYGDGLLEKWAEINTIRKINNTHVEFDITLSGEIDFSKCKRLYIRGANKAGVWSVVSTDLKQCHVVDSHSQIQARIVIDALGTTDSNKDSIGGDVFLEENAAWITTDVDYTPFKNVLSAVWPSLRYKSYQWGVVEVNSNNAQTFYKEFTDVVITDPCSHPNTVICGQTDKNFANIHFNETEYLTHGRRYSVCIYAPETVIKHEKWTETLDTVTSCSDGVTVDLTPPVPGKVWIGPDPIVFYQTSSSDITVSWDSFIDVEEESHAMHSSGIKQYFISIGSVEGGVDIVDNHNVGVTNHMSFHNLQLQNGHKYFVTVKGIDFINRTAEVRSSPITVDTTPPEISGESIYINGRLISNLTVIQACWEDVFIDVQSGIDYYTWGVGSLSGQDDIIPFSEIRENCGVSAEDEHFDLTEGHPYFITISAFNRAHLFTVKSSWAYIYDMSPPTAGHVYDGSSNTTESPTKDIDYQRDMTHLSVYWEGFHDPHSVIKYFNVHIGTCPGCNDVMPEHTVGINTDFNVQNLNLQAGIKYFTTVTACNTGNLCTSVTTDGVIIDNSPPVQGVVQDGVYEHDIEYQSTRNYITAKWFGFVDSQSGIDHFVIRAGTSKGSSDVYPPTSLTSFDMVLLTALPNQLPLNHRIYISIRAYNKAGLYSESISNGFIVDISAPVIVEKPSLSGHLGTFFDGTTVLRSAFRFQWNVEDSQSDIQKQYISLSSHIYGQFNTSSITCTAGDAYTTGDIGPVNNTGLGPFEVHVIHSVFVCYLDLRDLRDVAGIIREYTLTGLDFPDGGLYYIKLIVCNGAKICTESESDSIMVDTTPPTSGMFAVSTHHAANLQRHTIGSMSWSEYRINVALLGFNDLHSGIDKYYVSVGSEFMAFDLNKVPGSPMEFHHNDSGIQYLDEGPMQSFVVSTQLKKNYDHVFISVWAVNKVGLRSSMIHYKFQLIPGGYLDLIRRCTALTCLGHCICSPKYKRCHLNGDVCADVTTDNRNTLIAISDIIDLSDDTDVEFTPSNTFLSAKWKISKQQGLSPLWYEWSVGLTTQDLPEGVIDASKDPLWHHSGQNREATYSLKRGHELTELLTYSVFVRVWYSSNTYAIFKSNGVTVQAEEIHVNTQRGAAVAEKLPSFWKNDVDFILPGSLYTVVWKNVFMAKVGSVQKFNLYISTFKGGADLHKVNLDIDSSVNAVNISRLTMSPGIVYYSNVVAYTFSGLQTVVSSDGIMVDSSSPIFGIVYDGLGLNDIKYQNKSDIASASWHGFADTESGIIKYTWCVGTNRNDKDCDIVPWKTIGMHTSVSTSLQNHLNNGQIIYNKVIATDGVGHTSDITSSNGVTVDTTPPVPIMFSHAADNFITNPSFEETHGCIMDTDDISVNNLCDNDNCYQPLSWSKVGCLVTIKSDVDTAHDGRSFIYLKGTIQQNIQQLSSGNLYKLSFVTSHPHINTAVISNIEGSVKFGHKEYVFHIFTKENQSEIAWHLHTFYFTPNTNSSDLIISNLNRNIGFLVDNVKIQAVEVHPNSASETPVQVHTVGLHRWSSIHASWNFVDFGSPITEYLWAIGNTRGNAEMQHFQSVGVNNFGYNYNITLAHSSQVHVTVVAINAAGLQAKAYSAGVNIDNTPPVINQVHDGVGVDIDGQTSNIISANWDVIDPESDIDYCEWSIGLQPYGNELQPFTKTTDVKSASISFDEYIISQKTVYTTVRCHNKAGLYSTATSDGVTISDIPPSSDHAVITIIPQSLTEYSPGDYYQGDKTSVRIKWSGFADQFGIMSFVVQFDGESIHLKNSILDINKQVSYMVMTGLHLPDTSYTASIAAMNAMYIRSSKIYTNITVNTSTPTVVDGSKLSTVKKDDEIIINWSDCFINAGSLVYEVSVGTTQGGADVIQWQETKNTFINILLTEKLKSKSNLNLFFLVRAIDHNGAYSSISDDISV